MLIRPYRQVQVNTGLLTTSSGHQQAIQAGIDPYRICLNPYRSSACHTGIYRSIRDLSPPVQVLNRPFRQIQVDTGLVLTCRDSQQTIQAGTGPYRTYHHLCNSSTGHTGRYRYIQDMSGPVDVFIRPYR